LNIKSYNAQDNTKSLTKGVGIPASLGTDFSKAEGAYNDTFSKYHESQDHETFMQVSVSEADTSVSVCHKRHDEKLDGNNGIVSIEALLTAHVDMNKLEK
jgi:hypothetical protein